MFAEYELRIAFIFLSKDSFSLWRPFFGGGVFHIYFVFGNNILEGVLFIWMISLIILLCLAMVLLFLSIAGAIAIGHAFDNLAYGFLIIGGVYLLLTIAFLLIKDKLIEGLQKLTATFENIEGEGLANRLTQRRM